MPAPPSTAQRAANTKAGNVGSNTRSPAGRGPGASMAAAKASSKAKSGMSRSKGPGASMAAAKARSRGLGQSKSLSRGPGASMAASKANAMAKSRAAASKGSATGPRGMFGSKAAPKPKAKPDRWAAGGNARGNAGDTAKNYRAERDERGLKYGPAAKVEDRRKSPYNRNDYVRGAVWAARQVPGVIGGMFQSDKSFRTSVRDSLPSNPIPSRRPVRY